MTFFRLGDEFEKIVNKLSSTPIKDSSGLEETTKRLEDIFLACCDNYPGAVVVRRSYGAFQVIKESDCHDWEHQKMQNSSKRSRFSWFSKPRQQAQGPKTPVPKNLVDTQKSSSKHDSLHYRVPSGMSSTAGEPMIYLK
ncbi:hypothetical protein CPB86DRAFT_563929 [Serendipita vermifera]|nr:hypothetical protein CPB86DRAFT_563929 [Serendipita vermifera]